MWQYEENKESVKFWSIRQATKYDNGGDDKFQKEKKNTEKFQLDIFPNKLLMKQNWYTYNLA